jgi:hypothetical protein
MKFVTRTKIQIDLGLVPLVSPKQREEIIDLELQLDQTIELIQDEGTRIIEGKEVDNVIMAMYDVDGYFGELEQYIELKEDEKLTEKRVKKSNITPEQLLEYLDLWNGSSIISFLKKKLEKLQ